jgi:biopolymer transport protein ExbB/TolQ
MNFYSQIIFSVAIIVLIILQFLKNKHLSKEIDQIKEAQLNSFYLLNDANKEINKINKKIQFFVKSNDLKNEIKKTQFKKGAKFE